MRKEHDFLGELEVADELYYGVQTIRALENSILQENIWTKTLSKHWQWLKKHLL